MNKPKQFTGIGITTQNFIVRPDQTIKFLNALGGFITFQTFDDNSTKNPQLTRILQGSLEQNLATLTDLNKLGAGIHVMVNEGDGKGRAKQNVIKVRAVFADFDGVPLPDKWLIEPSIVLESSPNKYHSYWLLADNLPLKQFRPLQQAIAKVFDSDTVVCDLPRVMRVAGFYHQKSKPFLSQFIKCDSKLRYKASQLLTTFPIEEKPAYKETRALPDKQVISDATLSYAQKALAGEYDRVVTSEEGFRNVNLNKAAFALGQLVGGGLLNQAEVESTLLQAGMTCGLSESESRQTIISGLQAGLLEPRYFEPKELATLKPTLGLLKSYRQCRKARLSWWAK